MKSPVELNSFFLKFFCYITWFDKTRDWRACKRGLYVEFYCFFETIGYWFEKLQNALTHTPNFGIRSVFFKGPGSIFLKVQIRVQVRFIMYAFLKAGSYIFINTWNSAFLSILFLRQNKWRLKSWHWLELGCLLWIEATEK